MLISLLRMKPLTQQCMTFICLCLFLVSSTALANEEASDECVVILHGLLRGSGNMSKLAHRFQQAGYQVANIDYPSIQYPIAQLAKIAVGDGIQQCQQQQADTIHFVTHSLGGILVRQYFQSHQLASLGRVVMLGPPNNGSEVVDHMIDVWGFKWLTGPTGMRLGTKDSDIPKSLGRVNFELGVIAGTRSINPMSVFLPNPDDGLVSLESTKVAGMKDFIALSTMHLSMVRNDDVIKQALYFLKHGRFKKEFGTE